MLVELAHGLYKISLPGVLTTQHPPLSRTTGADLGSGMFVDVFDPFDSFNKTVRHNLVDFEK
jgi:hypothetical protein